MAVLIGGGFATLGTLTSGFECGIGEYVIDVVEEDQRYCIPPATAEAEIQNLKTALTIDVYTDTLSVPVRLASIYSDLRDAELKTLMSDNLDDVVIQPILEELHQTYADSDVTYYNTLKDRVLVADPDINDIFGLRNYVIETEYKNGANPFTIIP